MNYPFNEPIQVKLKAKGRFLSILNRIPYIEYPLWFFKERHQRLRKYVIEEIFTNPRIVQAPWVLSHLELREGRILDAGCCESKLSIELASLGYEVYGVDIRDYPIHHPNFHFKKANMMNMPFPDNFFDYVISISTLEHIGCGFYDDPIDRRGDRKGIMEMKRVMKPTGKMLITLEYGRTSLPKSGFWHGKARYYNKDSLKALLHGLIIDKKEYFIMKEGNWLPCSDKEAENADPNTCEVLLRLTKATVHGHGN